MSSELSMAEIQALRFAAMDATAEKRLMVEEKTVSGVAELRKKALQLVMESETQTLPPEDLEVAE